MNKILAFLAALAMRILERFANGLWQELWLWIITRVVEAEQKWIAEGHGAQRKEWVLDQLMQLITERAKELSWLQRQLLWLFLDQILNTLVDTINEELGRDWGRKIDELEDEIAKWIPFIKPINVTGSE